MNDPPARYDRLVHLVRHGEVHNPDHIVYADIPGYSLSVLGREQASETAAYLASRPVELVVTSPLQRAIETAGFVAARHGIGVTVDEELTEWRLAMLWAGLAWDELDVLRPGELAAYLTDPADLPFSPESLPALGDRMADAARTHASRTSGDVVIVSHQDPLQAATRVLCEAGFAEFAVGKPAHATVISLDPATSPWSMAGRFSPTQGALFPPMTDG